VREPAEHPGFKPNRLEQLGATARDTACRHVVARLAVGFQHVSELALDCPHGVQRIHPALQDEREPVPPLAA
jgi:hypothetical protein